VISCIIQDILICNCATRVSCGATSQRFCARVLATFRHVPRLVS